MPCMYGRCRSFAQSTIELDESNQFTHFKVYNKEINLLGSLKTPHERFYQYISSKLQLTQSPSNIQIQGINETASNLQSKCIVNIQSRFGEFSTSIS